MNKPQGCDPCSWPECGCQCSPKPPPMQRIIPNILYDRYGNSIYDPSEVIPMDYVLWLIEHPDNGNQRPFYFGWEEGEKGWTADINAAFKFETREAAEKMAGGVGLLDYQINDHKWMDHKPTSNLDVA